MKRRLSVLLVALFAFGVLGSATPASAAEACADPNCPWSPVTAWVYDTLWWVGQNCEWHLGDTCPL